MDCKNFIEYFRLLGMICWILRNRVVTSQLLMFEGKFIHEQAGECLMVTCSSKNVTVDCTMEFLHNNATVEILRKSEEGCHSTGKLCDPDVCSCNKEDCKSYTWNFTTASVKQNDSFGCGMRDENYSKVYLTLKFNGTDFNSPTTVIVSKNKASTTLHSSNTKPTTTKGVTYHTINTTFPTKKSDSNLGVKCWQSYLSYTMVGFGFTILTFASTYIMSIWCCTGGKWHSKVQECMKWIRNKIEKSCKNQNIKESVQIGVFSILFIIMLMIPVIKGFQDDNICRGEELYLILGSLLAFIFVIPTLKLTKDADAIQPKEDSDPDASGTGVIKDSEVGLLNQK